VIRPLGLLLLAALGPAAALAAETTPPPTPDGAAPPAVSTSSSEPAEPASTAHRHLGFFIRPEGGYAWLTAGTSFRGSKAEVSGSGAFLAIAIGAAVSEDLIVAGTGWHFFVNEPELKLDGSSLGTASGASAALLGYGVAVTWYLHPSNFYLSVNPALAQLVAADGSGNNLSSDFGPGLRAAAGKEWWVSDHWGVGLAASVTLCWIKVPEALSGGTWRSSALSLSLSATWN
jgi:hypothetical protein